MHLNQVTVSIEDYNASVAFYRALGLKLIVDSPPRYGRFECPVDEDHPQPSTFSISTDYGPPPPSDKPVCYFETEKLDEIVRALSDQGYEVKSQPEDKSYGWREADVKDPSGNVIRLFWAGKNRRFPDWRVKDA